MIEAAEIYRDVVLVSAGKPCELVQWLPPATFCHSLSKGCKSNAALAFGLGGQWLCPVANQRFGSVGVGIIGALLEFSERILSRDSPCQVTSAFSPFWLLRFADRFQSSTGSRCLDFLSLILSHYLLFSVLSLEPYLAPNDLPRLETDFFWPRQT